MSHYCVKIHEVVCIRAAYYHVDASSPEEARSKTEEALKDKNLEDQLEFELVYPYNDKTVVTSVDKLPGDSCCKLTEKQMRALLGK